MSPNLDDDPNEIWFLTAVGTDLVSALEAGPKQADFIVADGRAAFYASVEGRLELVQDRAKVDEIWSVVAAAWYEDGKDDPDLRLLKFTPSRGEAWITPKSGAKFLYEVARGNITNHEPDMGEHFPLTF